jgi:hypothetical protein
VWCRLVLPLILWEPDPLRFLLQSHHKPSEVVVGHLSDVRDITQKLSEELDGQPDVSYGLIGHSLGFGVQHRTQIGVCRWPFSVAGPPFVLDGAGEGIRTLDHLLGRHNALDGVAARMARAAKPVELSSREIALS